MTPEESRKEFEAWISTSPFERNIRRLPSDATKYAWPGQYTDYEVQLAWEAWQKAREK